MTFLGDGFIQYEVIAKGSGTRKRQAVQETYVSDTNLVTFSLITTETSGAIFQLGDSQSSEYMVVEVRVILEKYTQNKILNQYNYSIDLKWPCPSAIQLRRG